MATAARSRRISLTSPPPSPPLSQNKIASAGKGILAMDESNATCGKRLESIGLENTELNRQRYRELLVTTPGLNQYISGAILFEETLFQQTRTPGKSMVDCLDEQGIVPGIKVRIELDRRVARHAPRRSLALPRSLAPCSYFLCLNHPG